MATNYFTQQTSNQQAPSLPQDPTFGNAKSEVSRVIQKLVGKLNNKDAKLREEIDVLGRTNKQTQGGDNLDLVWHLDKIDHLIDHICELRFSDQSNQGGPKLDKTQVEWKRGSHGSEKTDLFKPNSFALSHKTGKVYVADTENRRISCFDKEGCHIRMKDLSQHPTPFPERIAFNQRNDLIWIYATDKADNANFIAIKASDFKVGHTIQGPKKVRSFTIDQQTGKPTFYCYNTENNCITHAGIDPDAKPVFCLEEICLESKHLLETEQNVEIERLEDSIFILLQGCKKYRIIQFGLDGVELGCYLPCEDYSTLQSFSLIPPNIFLLGVVADIPLVHNIQTSILSPREEKLGLKVCLVSFQGDIRGQLSFEVKSAKNFHTNDMSCSQIILHEGKLFCLLKCCEENLIVF